MPDWPAQLNSSRHGEVPIAHYWGEYQSRDLVVTIEPDDDDDVMILLETKLGMIEIFTSYGTGEVMVYGSNGEEILILISEDETEAPGMEGD
jgi:hypothetical protein